MGEVVEWLCTHHADEYRGGDLRTRLAVYHAIGLIADSAKSFSDETRRAIRSVDWRLLFRTRVIIVHQTWRVNSRIVWSTAVIDIPILLSEVRRLIAERSA